MPQTIDLNVIILPDDTTTKRLARWSKTVARKHKTFYTLDTNNHLPHLSLYSARYPVKNKNAVQSILQHITKEQKTFFIELSSFSVFSNYLFYNALTNAALQQLHECIVEKLNPLREGLISDTTRALTGLSPEQKEMILAYGYVSVKKLYMPHISITRFKEQVTLETMKMLLPDEKTVFRAEKLAISLFAVHGTCPQPLTQFYLNE